MPMVSPLMAHMIYKTEYYFVANRLLWDNWENFIVPGKVPILPAFPTWEINPALPDTYTKLLDYLRVPDPTLNSIADTHSEKISALAMAAYQFIQNEYYRHPILDDVINYKLTDGDNSGNTQLAVLRKRGWKKDYFTSALPTAQAGAAVDLPLGDIVLKGDISGDAGLIRKASDHTLAEGNLAAGAVPGPIEGQMIAGSDGTTVYDPNGTLEVDPVTITTLRRAFKLQEWLERAIRGGTRYVESIYSFFGVKSPDARLQRPEYIVGIQTPIQVSEVLNTTGTADLPQGNMAGHGIAVLSDSRSGSYTCQEHGYIIGITAIVPMPEYFQGIPKHFLKFKDPYQYFWSQFEHIGEQEISINELYAYQAHLTSELFGYTPRYAEYKQIPNAVAGQLKSTLKSWTFSRIFENLPALNSEFTTIDPATTDRIFAVTDPEEDKLIVHVYHEIQASRQMAIYGNPMM